MYLYSNAGGSSGLMAHVQEAQRKQQALQQLWPCIPAAAQQLDELEATLQKLDRVSLDLEKAAKALAKAQRKQAAAR